MQFFDLNIAYLEGEKSIHNNSAKKQNRLRLIIKAMELGYTGIAYNRTIKGAMSESDRCTIPPFPLSSLINVAPSLSSAVSFHRRLLGVPEKVPFRQYTRLTVVVDTTVQASALNSGNPVLKTYDLIAVKPLNQTCFDHACQSSQVDLISINFSEKLPFRLKFPMVKAAIARGLYFEIMYSSLMEDVQARRQLISNAKLLVDWTRGKNLIVTSAAPSVLELRGPNDVSNFLYMLGLSNERAKATISKNCRLLIANALRKKQFYKEAIRVEVMPAGAQTDSKEPWLLDYLDWDPISSGEGDLCLDDMAKSFANSGKVSQTVKAIDFSSIVNSGKPHGLQVKDDGFTVEGQPYQPVNAMDFTSKDVEMSKDTEKLQKPTPFHSNKSDEHGSALEKSQQAMLVDFPKASPLHEDLRISSSIFLQEFDKTDSLDEPELQKHVAGDAEDMLISTSSIRETPPEVVDLDVECGPDSKEVVSIKVKDVIGSGVDADYRLLVSDLVNNTEAGVSSPLQSADTSLNGLNTNSTIYTDMNLDSFIKRNDSDISVQVEEVSKEHDQREEHHIEVEAYTDMYLLAHTSMQVDSSPVTKDTDDIIVPNCLLQEDVTPKNRKQVEESSETSYNSLVQNKSGNNNKGKRPVSDQVCRFPFKRLLQSQFKKKGRKSSYKNKR